MKKSKFLILLLGSMVLLTSCGESLGGEDSLGGIVDKIWPNVWVLLAQIIAFVLMCIIVYFIAYKPVKAFIKKRQDYVENNIKDSEDKLEKARILTEEANNKIDEANNQSVEIINNAKDIATKKQQEIVAETEQILLEKKLRAQKEIEDERTRMEEEIHNTIVATALDASKEILKRELNEGDNAKLVNDFINQINEKDK